MSATVFNPRAALIKGAAWSLATRWGARLIGLANTMIMARLVLPADYGVVSMAFLVVGLISTLLDFSVTTALLRKGDVSRDEVDSAWTTPRYARMSHGSGLDCCCSRGKCVF